MVICPRVAWWTISRSSAKTFPLGKGHPLKPLQYGSPAACKDQGMSCALFGQNAQQIGIKLQMAAVVRTDRYGIDSFPDGGRADLLGGHIKTEVDHLHRLS